MSPASKQMLPILDQCCETFRFPMLDNGYIYLAASRLSLFRSQSDWALVIGTFGFSPRSGTPDLHVDTFASALRERDRPDRYISPIAYEKYLADNPHNEARFFFPVDDDHWEDPEDSESVANDALEMSVRGRKIALPARKDYPVHGIKLEDPSRVRTFEACRFLAATQRNLVLGTTEEQRVSVLPEMKQILQLEEWRHPDVVEDELPSRSRCFQQLAEVLATGNPGAYKPDEEPNTHWRHWPEAGRL